MYDFHYDLLTKIYIDYLNHDLSGITLFCNQNYSKDNILGLVANLSFMSDEEMKKEYHEDYYKNGNLIKMFETATTIAKKIVPNIEMVFSIEGCDKLDTVDDLEKLYNLGLRAIAPVWNDKNKYGSGIRTEEGLTELGKSLIIKAIDLGIAIDLSHANVKTFNDIVDLIIEKQKNGKEVTAYVSHSNCYSLCPRKRNITDAQIERLRDIKAYIGIFSNTNFVSLNNLSQKEYEETYIDHIKYVEAIYGSIDHIVLSTDDMKWCEHVDPSYGKSQLFPYHKLQKKMKNLLLQHYSSMDVDKLMYKNAEEVVKTIKKLK